jgi:hypothetical protein
MKKRDGTVLIEVPNKQVKEFYQKLKVKVPASLDIRKFKIDTLKLQGSKP